MTITEFVTQHCPALEEAAALPGSGRPFCPSSCLLPHPMWLQDPASPPASPLDTQIPWIPQSLFWGSLESPVFGVSPGPGWVDGAIPSPQDSPNPSVCVQSLLLPFACAMPGPAPCCHQLHVWRAQQGCHRDVHSSGCRSCLPPGLWERLWKIPVGLCHVQPVAPSDPHKSLSSVCLVCFVCLKLIWDRNCCTSWV